MQSLFTGAHASTAQATEALAKYKTVQIDVDRSNPGAIALCGTDESALRKAAKRLKQTLFNDQFCYIHSSAGASLTVFIDRERAIQRIISDIRFLPFERAAILWNKGMLFTMDGDEHGYRYSTSQARAIQAIRGQVDLVSIHNHTAPLPPSGIDLANGMINRERVSYVVTPHGDYRIHYAGEIRGAEIRRFWRSWKAHQSEVFGALYPAYTDEIIFDETWRDKYGDPQWMAQIASMRWDVISRVAKETEFFHIEYHAALAMLTHTCVQSM